MPRERSTDEKNERGTGTLYVVATPIGNLGDLSERAVQTLRTVGRVVAEDTRRTRTLLTHAAAGGKPLEALHAHSRAEEVTKVADRIAAGEDVALVTDAGTPSVSDPGGALVSEAVRRGIRVVPIPGPSAVLAALVGSGLAGDAGFTFAAFLPREGPPRRARIARIAETPEPVVLFEAPNRTKATLEELARATPARPACVARELTKVHEEFVRGTLEELAALDAPWLGEVAIVLGAHRPEERAAVDDAAVDARIDEELANGAHVKAIAERLAAWSGRPKRELYERVVARKTSHANKTDET
jgi:16S rRNA (cytidine1402-2'-O)-methyltransferase